jgi:hypothetical protein
MAFLLEIGLYDEPVKMLVEDLSRDAPFASGFSAQLLYKSLG